MRATRWGVLRSPSRSGCSPTARSRSNTAASEAGRSIRLSSAKSPVISSSNSMLSILNCERVGAARSSSPCRIIVSTNLGLDQAIGAVTAPVQHIDAAALRVIEDEEVVVPQQVHLLDGFQLIHGQDAELLALGNDGR